MKNVLSARLHYGAITLPAPNRQEMREEEKKKLNFHESEYVDFLDSINIDNIAVVNNYSNRLDETISKY